MGEPKPKLDYADPTDRPPSWWDRLPPWVHLLVRIILLYLLLIIGLHLYMRAAKQFP